MRKKNLPVHNCSLLQEQEQLDPCQGGSLAQPGLVCAAGLGPGCSHQGWELWPCLLSARGSACTPAVLFAVKLLFPPPVPTVLPGRGDQPPQKLLSTVPGTGFVIGLLCQLENECWQECQCLKTSASSSVTGILAGRDKFGKGTQLWPLLAWRSHVPARWALPLSDLRAISRFCGCFWPHQD